MATSGPDTFSTRSFYGSRTRAQRDRPRVPVIQLTGKWLWRRWSKHSWWTSDYSSPSEDESGEDDADVVEDDTESIEAEGEAARRSKTGCTSQNVRWRKWQPVCYDVAFKREPFPPPPLEDKTPQQYFKQFFDDALIDNLLEQTNLYWVQTTGTSIGSDHNEMEMYIGMLVMIATDANVLG